MNGLLFGVQAGDPLTVVGVVGLLACISLLAAYLPARRALNANPIDALRNE
jgi:ABC-type lipoprotein release transport system permease subunit